MRNIISAGTKILIFGVVLIGSGSTQPIKPSSGFDSFVRELPAGRTQLSIFRASTHTEIVGTCSGGDLVACDILATWCDDNDGTGQCGDDDNPNGCTCVVDD